MGNKVIFKKGNNQVDWLLLKTGAKAHCLRSLYVGPRTLRLILHAFKNHKKKYGWYFLLSTNKTIGPQKIQEFTVGKSIVCKPCFITMYGWLDQRGRLM